MATESARTPSDDQFDQLDQLDQLDGLRADLSTAALVMVRELTDTGTRTDLDQAIAVLGFDRTELERDTRTHRE